MDTRNGSHDVYLRRLASDGTFDRGPAFRPHEDRGAYRQGDPELFYGHSGWWVLWRDERRAEGADILIRAYRDENSLASETYVNEGVTRRDCRGPVGVETTRSHLLIAWIARSAKVEEIRLRLLGPLGEPLGAERIIRSVSPLSRVDALRLRGAPGGLGATLWWIEEGRESARLQAVQLSDLGVPLAVPIDVGIATRVYDVLWSGDRWLVLYASGGGSGQRRRVYLRVLDGNLAPLGARQRLASAAGGMLQLCAIPGGIAALASAADAPQRRTSREPLIAVTWLDPAGVVLGRLRPAPQGEGRIRGHGATIAPLPHGIALAWVTGSQPARDLHCLQLAAWPDRRASPWNVLDDRGRAAQRDGAIAATPDGALTSTFVQAGPTGQRIEARVLDAAGAGSAQLVLDRGRAQVAAPALARWRDGTSLIAWLERDRRGRTRLRGRLLDSSGAIRGGVLRIQRRECSPPGGVVALAAVEQGFWAVFEQLNRAGDTELISRLLDLRGRPRGAAEVLASTCAGSSSMAPALAWREGSGGVVLWQAPDGSGVQRVWGRLVEPAIGPLGAAVEVDDHPALAGGEARVAMAADGSILATWTRAGIDRTDVVARGFDAGLIPRGASRRISAGAGEQDHPDVASLAPGYFLVVWEDDLSRFDEIFIRAVSGNAEPLGSWYRVHRDRSGVVADRVKPRIVAAGQFASIVWMDRRRSMGFDVYHTRAGRW